MARHQADLVRCARLPGVSVGRVCTAHDGRCVACDSMVRLSELARVCDGHGFAREDRCLLCGRGAMADAYYCKGCLQLEKDRDGCPAMVNSGTAWRDWFYQRTKHGLRSRVEA